jgi:RNA recognition motif-containing protein
LPLDAKPEDLRALFEKYGVVTECDVLNRFGFVHMKSEDMAKRAIQALHNSEFMGSRITVEVSNIQSFCNQLRNVMLNHVITKFQLVFLAIISAINW